MANYDLNNIYEWPLVPRLIAGVVVFFVVLYLGYTFDIAKLTRQVKMVAAQESDLKTAVDFAFDKEAMMESEVAQLPILQNLLIEWQGKLVKAKQLPELLNQILKVGTANQLEFNFFNPGNETKMEHYSSLPIKVVVVGNYHQIANFISQLANMPTIVEITNFTISSPDRNTSLVTDEEQSKTSSILTAEILLEVYHLD